ncbi:beta-2-glycoprotein 1 isoform X1 [Microcaecilia unicolor]|uniref:Beta-2-glycoprotein 1 n=1 Tax=Microcaecilia unicolor TaxID=1415580 RepID=A0A6P7WQ91_9AMPH|nr:beta-2-glycoprotein 1-like isoform X1 [Microcaecilia unicolor]
MSYVLLLWGIFFINGVVAKAVCPGPPQVEFASVHPEKRLYEPGEEVSYVCQSGYIYASGTRRAVCTNAGRWTSVTLRCKLRTCVYPGLLHNGEIHHTELTYQSVISFSCNEGYILRGANSSQCNEKAEWTEELPVCESVTCPFPPVPEFARIVFHLPRPGNESIFGDVVRYACLPNYALIEHETVSCLANGNWSHIPECKDIRCPRPTGIENGFVSFNLDRLYHYMEKVSYGCMPNYVLDGPRESRCEKTGNWSIKPSCKAPCSISVKRAEVLYYGQRVKLQGMAERRIQHAEIMAFFCKDEEKKCGYPVPTQCMDGVLRIPECFKEYGRFSALFTTEASSMKQCDTVNSQQ